MRVLDFFALGIASIAAICPLAVRGQPLDDTRHQRRQQAAEILRTALRDSSDRGLSPQQRLELYAAGCSRAVELLGPDSYASARLSEAIQTLASAGGLTDDAVG